MRLWHEDLLPYLPRQQILGQNRELAALRGKGWLKSHETVNYIFKHNPYYLYQYHLLVLQEMTNRGYKPNKLWYNANYRGKKCKPYIFDIIPELDIKRPIYPEHNNNYLIECVLNLHKKFTEAPVGKYKETELNKFYNKYNYITGVYYL